MFADSQEALVAAFEKHFGCHLKLHEQNSPKNANYDVFATKDSGRRLVRVNFFKPNNADEGWQIGGWSWIPDLTPLDNKKPFGKVPVGHLIEFRGLAWHTNQPNPCHAIKILPIKFGGSPKNIFNLFIQTYGCLDDDEMVVDLGLPKF